MKLPDEVRAMFRKAGSKGGKRRKMVLTAQQRKDSARKAARARWAKEKKQR
jgi:hypothetical protein